MSKTVAIFKLDDSRTPGLAKVEVLREKASVRGRRIWSVRVLEVLKPSAIRRCKIGQTLNVADLYLDFKR